MRSRCAKANLDLQQKELTIRTQKTGRVQILPLAKPLLARIESLPVGDDPQASLCPSFQGKTVSWLSNQFYEVMASAGLVQSRGDHHKKEGKAGRGAPATQPDQFPRPAAHRHEPAQKRWRQ